MLPHCREVMGEEDHIEDQDQEGYRLLWEMLQGPVGDAHSLETGLFYTDPCCSVWSAVGWLKSCGHGLERPFC